jgi:hypothetical protein
MALSPPALPGPAPVGTGGDDPYLHLFGLVRDIRAEAQNIARALAPVRAALALENPVAQAAELQQTMEGLSRVMSENAPVIDQRFAALRGLVEARSALYDAAGDAITELENQWREMQAALTWSAVPAPAELLGRLGRVEARLREIEWQAAVITVPNRVRQHLRTKRTGGQLRFHEAFKDELSDEHLRVDVLRYLREHAASFSGVVDVPSGVIYRIAPGPRRRAASWLLLVGLATIGAYGFVYALTHGVPSMELAFGQIAGLEPERFPELMGAYWGLLIGSLAHLVIAAVKQEQRGDPGTFRALEDWFVWVHVREMALIIGILSLFAILVGLAVTSPKAGSITLVTAIAAGYASDSILGLFITRFDAAARAAVPSVGQAPGAAPG